MKRTYLVGALVLGVSVQAFANSDSYYDSQTTFSWNVDADISVLQNGGGPYNNGINPTASGDGANPLNFTNEFTTANGGYDEAAAESTSFVNGSASQFQGINYFFDFTNNGTSDENATISETVLENLYAVGDSALTYAYGGWSDSSGNFGYFTNGVDNFGNTYPDYPGFSGGSIGGNEYQGTANFTETIAAGQTVEVQFWASGSTFAQSPAPTPEPASLLALAGLGFLIRRRKKA